MTTTNRPGAEPGLFAARLNELRESARLSVAELADSAGVTRQQVYNLESGKALPSWALACKLADALGVSVERFRTAG